MLVRHTLATALVLSTVSISLGFQTPVGIYSNVSGHPTNNVPGLNIPFDTVLTTTFDRPYRSPDGSRWIITALTSDPSTAIDEVIITGSGMSGTLALQEGVTNIEPGRVCDSASIDQRVAINNAGDFVFTCNLSGATTDDEIIGKSIGGTISVAAREGQSIGGLIAGASLGTTLDTPGIDIAGKVSFRSTLTGVPTGQTTGVFLGDLSVVAAQTGVTNAGNGFTWFTITAGDPYYSGNGATWFTHGDTNDPTTTQDYVVTRNNTVLMMEGTSPGGGLAGLTTTNIEAFMGSNGDWIARGSVTGNDDFFAHNGLVVSKTGDLVPGGLPGEMFDDAIFTPTYFHMALNNQGHYVYGGVTTNPNVDANAVMVWSDGVTSTVFLREGDPVDLDGNGLLDDNVYLSVFNDFDGFLGEDGYFYFFANLRNTPSSPFTDVAQAFMRVQVPEPATLTLLAIGGMFIIRKSRRSQH